MNRLPTTLCFVTTLTMTLSAAVGADRQKDVERLIQPAIEAGVLPGAAVGIIENGRTHVFGYGHIEPDKAAAPTGGTIYEIGSISKVFTGILLADAARRGEVAIDDPLSKHLPKGVRAPQRDGKEILLWHLATHTSGLPRLPDNMNAAGDNPYKDYGEKELWAFLDSGRPGTAPGMTYAYSNLGAGLLGTVLAHVAGKPYSTLIEERIARPLDMQDTTLELSRKQLERLAPPFAGGAQTSSWEFAALAGCGGIRSTVDDLLELAQATLSKKTDGVHASVAQSTQRRYTLPGGAGGLGLGWHIAADGTTLWHNGQTGGYYCALFVNPLNDTASVVLSNSSDATAGEVAEKIIQMLAGMAVQPPKVRPTVNVATAQLDSLVGEYPSTLGFTITITREGDALFARLTNQAALRVWPESSTLFFYREVEAELGFDIDTATGKAKAVTLFQNGAEMRCPRKD